MEQKSLNEREAAVLGLLAENPLYGYTIEKKIGERGMRYWTDIGFSSIYYVLKRLESRQLITSSHEQQEDKPSRKIYTITDEGRALIRKKIRDILTHPRRVPSPFDLGLVNLRLIPADEVSLCLKTRLQILDTTLGKLRSLKQKHTDDRHPYYVLALFDRAAAHIEAERAWLEGFIREVDAHASG